MSSGEFVLGAQFVVAIRLSRKNRSSGTTIHLRRNRLRYSSSGGAICRLRGASRLRGIRLRNSFSGEARLRVAIRLREFVSAVRLWGGIGLRRAIRLRGIRLHYAS